MLSTSFTAAGTSFAFRSWEWVEAVMRMPIRNNSVFPIVPIFGEGINLSSISEDILDMGRWGWDGRRLGVGGAAAAGGGGGGGRRRLG